MLLVTEDTLPFRSWILCCYIAAILREAESAILCVDRLKGHGLLLRCLVWHRPTLNDCSFFLKAYQYACTAVMPSFQQTDQSWDKLKMCGWIFPSFPSCLLSTYVFFYTEISKKKKKKYIQKPLFWTLKALAQSVCVVLQWIPAHTGVRGNEVADQLTKKGRKKEQRPSDLSYREVKTLIHNKKKAIFHSKTGGYNPDQDVLHQMPGHQQTPQNRPLHTE